MCGGQVSEAGALLVRPDGHVACRFMAFPQLDNGAQNPRELLAEALQKSVRYHVQSCS
jgi:hypothetical protein